MNSGMCAGARPPLALARPRQMVLGFLALLVAVYIAQRATIIARWRKGDRRVIDPVRRFNRRWTNPAAIKYLRAGRKWSPYALIQHAGRRSGRPYATPVVAVRVPGGFLIPLAYGPHVDWFQNLVAAGGGKLEWQSENYVIGVPEIQDAAATVGAFPLPWQFPLRLYGISRFVRVARLDTADMDAAKPASIAAGIRATS